jgi:CRP-like cAMP-binding protein
LQQVLMAEGQVLVAPGEPQSHVYFPLGCLASVMVRLRDGRCVEVGLIGSEGFVGLPVLLETDPGPHHVVCQVAGQALRMPSSTFRAILRRSRALRRLLYRYSGLRLIEQAQLVACNTLHPVSPRLARWLLMASDRLPADEFRLTQEFLATMLAVRRPYLNSAAQDLQRSGFISYHRGQIKLLNRSALETTACEDYSVLRAEYARLLTPVPS